MDLFNHIYLRDILDRNKIVGEESLEILADVLASGISSLTNPTQIANTFLSNGHKISSQTINTYLKYFENSFLLSCAKRYDVMGRKYISTTNKYYFVDVGLRNARLNFRQIEETHIMENVIYNELCVRGYNVDVGAVEVTEKDDAGVRKQKKLEIDFICNLGSKRYYIQSAYSLQGEGKMKQELKSLMNVKDNFKKIIITKDNVIPHYNDDGILIINMFDFLLDPNSLEK